MKKILCFCGSGLGSSFMLEMNIKEALKKLNNEEYTVEHSTIDDVLDGAADIFVCTHDLVRNAENKGGKVIGINNIMAKDEIFEKLKKAIEE